MKGPKLLIALSVVFVCGWSSPAQALQKCTICHGKQDFHKVEATGRKVSLYVDEAILKKSMHASKDCVDCHVDVVEIPHKQVGKVNCRRCHYTGNSVGAPEKNLDQYENSVHGMEVAKGNAKAPVCQDCHGGHDVFSHMAEESQFYRNNIPKTCGTCHIDEYAVYSESVHGVGLQNGNIDSPVCSSCHGEHNIKRPSDSESRVSPIHVTETCSECHGPKGVVSKYGIKTDRTTTFEESFHGVAQLMENMMVANCSSCHGYHDIRPESDPKSSINRNNIVKTCGKEGCHPEASSMFASGQIHIDPKSEESGIVYYISKAFMVLTISTLAGLFIFIILDLFRRAKKARGKR